MHPEKPLALACTVVGALILGALAPNAVAQSGNVVPLSLNPLMVNNDQGDGDPNWGGFRSFEYAGIVPADSPSGKYAGFIIDHNIVDDPSSGQGAGVGINFTESGDYSDSPYNYAFNTQVLGVNAADFPIFDRASYGTNFDPDDYMIEVEYKVLAGNVGTRFNVNIAQDDGYRPDPAAADVAGQTGKRTGEQIQWGFTDIVNYFNSNTQPNGFATIRRNLTDAMGMSTQNTAAIDPFLFQNGDGAWQTNNVLRGDGLPDFDVVQGHVPNGAVAIHLQAPYDEDFDHERLHLEIRGVRVVRRTMNNEVGRLDARSGIGRRFGTQFTNQDETGADMAPVLYDWDGNGVIGGTEFAIWRPTTQLRRFDQNGFTNLFIDTDDVGQGSGGFGSWQDPYVQTFDGTQATLNVTARLTQSYAPGEATINVVLNDLDGNDTAAGNGGEEYGYALDLGAMFNTSTMTTVSIDLSDFTQRVQAFELLNDGDTLLTDFNLYYLGVVIPQGTPPVHLEIESITVTTPDTGPAGDYDDDGDVDGGDFLAWQRQLGSSVTPGTGADGDNSGTVNGADLNVWKGAFGTPTAAAASSVPEPGTSIMAAAAGIAWLSARSRRRGAA